MSEIDNRVKDLRLNASLTQEELGIRAGVSRQTINAIEQRRFLPSLPLALKLAHIFEEHVEEIFWFVD